MFNHYHKKRQRSSPSVNPWIEGLIDGYRWGTKKNKQKIRYRFFDVGDADFYGYQPQEWDNEELVAWRNAIDAIQSICGIQFVNSLKKQKSQNEISIYSFDDSLGSLGFSFTPGSDNQGAIAIASNFYKNQRREYTSSITPGSYSWITFIHELGHSIGLKHPHELGKQGQGRFPGLRPKSNAFKDSGKFGQNAQPFTVMSYVDQSAQNGLVASEELDYGFLKTLGALDIATLQHIYGLNHNTATGNDVYFLPTKNKEGTGWISIWDAGGWDCIDGSKAKDRAVIDLRNATLALDAHAGGFTSKVKDVYGGFTIAHDWDGQNLGSSEGLCVIEEAIGGSAADILIGNSAANRLTGGPGADRLTGGLGGDEFVIDMMEPYGRRYSDKIIDFNFREGDYIRFKSTVSGFSRLKQVPEVLSIKHIDLLQQSAHKLIFIQNQGFLYFNQNGTSPGWGEGGLVVILKGQPDLSIDDIVWD